MSEKIVEKNCRIFTVSSGKGGVGKTSIVINTGLALTRLGYKVCVFDADANLANINIMLKQTPEHTLEHVINGQKSVAEIMLQFSGLYVIPGASGISEFISFNSSQRKSFLQAVETCQQVFDFILIDSAAGISKSVLAYMQIAQQNILIITPEPTSLTDAFSLLRVFHKQHSATNISVIVNQVSNKKQAHMIFKRFSVAVKKYIGLQVEYISWIKKDDMFSACIRQQTPLYLSEPNSITGQCFNKVAEIIKQRQPLISSKQSIKRFIHLQSRNRPNFSTSKNINQSTEEDIQQIIVRKINENTLSSQQAKDILNVINQPSIKPEIQPWEKRDTHDQDALMSSIKYAQLAAEC